MLTLNDADIDLAMFAAPSVVATTFVIFHNSKYPDVTKTIREGHEKHMATNH